MHMNAWCKNLKTLQKNQGNITVNIKANGHATNIKSFMCCNVEFIVLFFSYFVYNSAQLLSSLRCVECARAASSW